MIVFSWDKCSEEGVDFVMIYFGHFWLRQQIQCFICSRMVDVERHVLKRKLKKIQTIAKSKKMEDDAEDVGDLNNCVSQHYFIMLSNKSRYSSVSVQHFAIFIQKLRVKAGYFF